MKVDDKGENIRRSDPGGTSALVTTGMPGVTNTSQFSKISFVATSVISLSPTITRGSVIHECGREVNQANQCACNSREAHSLMSLFPKSGGRRWCAAPRPDQRRNSRRELRRA